MTEMQQKRTLGLAVASLIFGCLFLFPFLGIIFSLIAIILGIIALVKISNNKETLKGGGLAIAGIVLGGVGVILIPIIALLAAIAIPNLLRARLNANETSAVATVKTISTAVESYKVANDGRYPSDEYDLRYAQPPYLKDSYNNKTHLGYKYSLNFNPNGYEIIAMPETCGVSGIKILMVTNGEISEKPCK